MVSKQGVNLLATFQRSAFENAPTVIAFDQNNPDIYNKELTSKVFCLPQAIGSTSGGMTLHAVCHMGIAPKAMLFSKHIDSLSLTGVILADVWSKEGIITVDQLGDKFLAYVEDGMTISVYEDGRVVAEASR
ncbi:MAG: DUF126 domain-containing protein [Bacillota bacterium]